ncbi:MAG: PAS domain-containing sensor histidine kinase [Bacteroidota bacterium]
MRSQITNQGYTSFFEEIAMFIYNFNTLKIMDVNSATIEKYGFSREEFQKMKITDLGEKISPKTHESEQFKSLKVFPNDLWLHKNKSGDQWLVQFTSQEFRFHGEPSRLALAHDLSDIQDLAQVMQNQLPAIHLPGSSTPFGLIEWSKDLEVRHTSVKAAEIFETSNRNITGKKIADIPFLNQTFIQNFKDKLSQTAGKAAELFKLESSHTNRAGRKVSCIWHNSALLDSKGDIAGVCSIIEDVTEVKNSELSRHLSENKFRVMSEQSFAGMYVVDGTRFTYANPRLGEITGYTPQKLTKDVSLNDLIHPDDRKWITRLRRQWEKTKRDSFEIGLRIISKTGEVRHVRTYGSAFKSSGRNKLLGVLVDQTSQVKALENFKLSVDSYQSLFDSITDSIYILDLDGIFIEVNKAVLEMYGYDKEEILGKGPSFLAAENKVDIEKTMQKFERAVAGIDQNFRWWGKRKNGEIFPKEIKLTKGTFFGHDVIIAVARDITETMEREETLRRNEELFEQLFKNSPLGIVLLDEGSNIRQVNDSFEAMFGFSSEEIEGEDLDKLIVPEEDLEHARSLAEREETFTLTKKRRTKSGELIDVLIYGVPVMVKGKTIGMFGIYMDITDRIQAEEKVIHSLEEKEILLAEIHHRVKNNLAVITGLLELQYHNLKNEDAKAALRDSQLRINSMGLIHEKLYQNESLSDIDFGDYARELIDVIVSSQRQSPKQIDIQFDTVPVKLPIKKAVPCGLIINEIVTNSLKYAFQDDHPNPVIRIKLTRSNGEATIEISDNGIGLNEPFEELDTESLGVLLIKTLTSQLEADLEVDGTNGTCYRFTFVLGEKKK